MNGIVNSWGKGWPGKQGAWRVVLLLVLLSQTIMGCQAEEAGQEPVAVEVMRVGFDRTTDMPVVILRDKGETRAIPIWIGAFEARAIAMELEGAAAPRPLTHDLLKSILQGAGVVFEKVLVSELKEGTYYARIFLTSAGKDFEVDSRPSDAIALALRFRKPILVARSLMEGARPWTCRTGASRWLRAFGESRCRRSARDWRHPWGLTARRGCWFPTSAGAGMPV